MKACIERALRTVMRAWVLALALPLFPALSLAEPVTTRYATVDLLAATGSLPAGGGNVALGLYIAPKPGWHSYWANPGDAGKEPSISWHLPENFSVSDLAFPAPRRLPFGSLLTYGYEEPILLLAGVTVPAGLDVGDAVEISGRASWVVCNDEICVPDRAEVSIVLPVGDGAVDAALVPRFAQARDRIPRRVPWPATFTLRDDMVHVEIAPADVRQGYDNPYLFVESKHLVRYTDQKAELTPSGLTFTLPAAPGARSGEAAKAVFAFTDATGVRQAVSFRLSPARDTPAATAGAAAPGNGGGVGFLTAIVFAFLGGIILNLMPCVFPILSIKALSLVELVSTEPRAARASAVIYTLGILVAFSAVAAVMVTFRAAGEAVGWGFHMQNPPVVVGLGLLMVAIGMNLLGAFEIGARITGVGQGLTQGGETRQAFFTGVLAVVVATPCMAPFMAAALGYALTQPAAVSIIVFMALGLGLAFPYLLLSFVPAAAALLPKPGAWMATFKHCLAFPMFVTALWLFWVVGRQLGPTSMFVALLSATALAFALWAYGRGFDSLRKGSWYAAALLGVIAGGFAFSQVDTSRIIPRAEGELSAGRLGGLALEHFDPERVRQYIAAGQPTFVYFTADWCLSCKVNERVALASDQVAETFNSRGIKVVEGDWTAQDPAITEWLEMYDRAGVPLYLYFPKGSSPRTATILPQILTPGIVSDAIDNADATSQAVAAASPVASTISSVKAPPDDPGAAEESYVIPPAAAEWAPVQDYIDLDTAWHRLDREILDSDASADEKQRRAEEERGPHPEIDAAVAAAAAIVRLGGTHRKTREAAVFLMEHTPGAAGQTEAMLLGAETLLARYPNDDDWPMALFGLDSGHRPGADTEIERVFEALIDASSNPLVRAHARYYAASRQLQQANAVETPTAERPGHREKGIALATGLSAGVEGEALQKRRRFTADDEPIPLPTLAEAEGNLLYNLNHLTVGSRLPDMSAVRLDGVGQSTRDFRGQVVLLDFWATWCGPCVASIPEMKALHERFPRKAFELISVSVDEKPETVSTFQERTPMPWTNWHIGPESDILRTWAVKGYPTYILIDRDGTMVARRMSMDDQLETLVESTVCGPAGGSAC